jgi:hypothetical protein
MPYTVAMDYYEAITVIEAQEALVAMNISDYPKMKGESRKKFYRQMRKSAQPQSLQKQMDFEDFISRMNDG